jgi:hypothetical protein
MSLTRHRFRGLFPWFTTKTLSLSPVPIHEEGRTIDHLQIAEDPDALH